jgi:glycosyltransferase involved in cell wall biosynthesis
MPRLAWFTPIPPAKTGVAQYNRELLPALALFHDIDLFVEGHCRPFVAPDARIRAGDAHDFVWKHRRDRYDLVVYQIGNAPCHDYMWAYLVRYPGLVVLHDGQLHHARARALLQRKRYDDYRREFWFNHPDANPDAAELGAEGLLGSLTYFWPMLRTVVESSRLVVVHSHSLAEQIREAHPNTRVETVEMGVPDPAPRAKGRDVVRQRHNIPLDAVLFGAFGKITPEKRIAEAVRALAAIGGTVPNAHLLLAGETVEYYDAIADARLLGVGGKVTVTGYLPDADMDDYVAAADVCLCMRWPSSRETSASWLRCLAAGRATIATDLVHTADMPMLDPRNWSADAEPIGVSIDILDEDHSLKLAMRRLAADAPMREMLGRNARRLWSERFRLEQMASRYRGVIDLALSSAPLHSSGVARLPRHLLESGTEHTDELLQEAGLSKALNGDFWSGRVE